jgi:hypothetical protein
MTTRFLVPGTSSTVITGTFVCRRTIYLVLLQQKSSYVPVERHRKSGSMYRTGMLIYCVNNRPVWDMNTGISYRYLVPTGTGADF